ncbi:hypothetical protein VL20_3539 [Microcystis panniformis FACHB-1757]|uniref:Uncharacterized protein n=1 Tax=Microcystis panniformis FACHB-1757 TaxID=1638788 RepID=A0A0K1S322_9CHRO|nr:hypothetical protein VL20_3539 [Microcystis panniformis FACHB-1757]
MIFGSMLNVTRSLLCTHNPIYTKRKPRGLGKKPETPLDFLLFACGIWVLR